MGGYMTKIIEVNLSEIEGEEANYIVDEVGIILNWISKLTNMFKVIPWKDWGKYGIEEIMEDIYKDSDKEFTNYAIPIIVSGKMYIIVSRNVGFCDDELKLYLVKQ